jgi:linoleate 10R-lipoxygenase
MPDSLNHRALESHDCHAFIQAARDEDPDASSDELSAHIFGSVIPTATLFSQAITHVVDFYLGEERQAERAEIVKLAASGSEEKILPYVHEALREYLMCDFLRGNANI